MTSTQLWVAITALVLCNINVSAVKCPETAAEAPKAVTLMASRFFPDTEAWIVSPNCTIEVIAARGPRPWEPDFTGSGVSLSINSEELDVVESIPSSVNTLVLISARLQGVVDLSGSDELKRLVLSYTLLETLERVRLPDNLKELTVRDSSELRAIENYEFPPNLEALYIQSNKVLLLKNQTFGIPSTLDLSDNLLQSLDFQLPSTLTLLRLSNNPIKSLGNFSFVNALQKIELEGTAIKVIQGVQWPSYLTELKLGSDLTNLELRQSDYDQFMRLEILEYESTLSSCAEPGELKELGSSNVYVISDEVFEKLGCKLKPVIVNP